MAALSFRDARSGEPGILTTACEYELRARAYQRARVSREYAAIA